MYKDVSCHIITNMQWWYDTQICDKST